MKGISLPINVIIILSIAVVVMMIIVTALFKYIPPYLENAKMKTKFPMCCKIWKDQYNCDFDKVDEIVCGGYTFRNIIEAYGLPLNENAVKGECGCFS